MNEKPEQRARRYRGDARSATCRKRVIGVTGALTALLTAVQVAATCASCHGDSLAGIDDAPPLTGPAFHKTWDGNALSSLFNRISAESEIPADSMGAAIRRGLALLRFTPESLSKYLTSNVRCTSCHQNDGTKATAAPLTGSHARFPKYVPRSGKVITLADRVNYCVTRSLSGTALPVDSREMNDILAYLAFISRDVPVGRKLAAADGLLPMKDTLVGDTLRGSSHTQPGSDR